MCIRDRLYRKQIAEIRRMKEHCLSAEMEKLLAMTAEMSQTPAAVSYTHLSERYMSYTPHIDALTQMATLIFDTMKKVHRCV